MQQCYAVERGEYSDRTTHAVYLRREDAEEAISNASGGEWEIAESPLDPPTCTQRPGQHKYHVRMQLHSGNKALAWDAGAWEPGDPESDTPDDGHAYTNHDQPTYMQWVAWATDKKHAIKICNERRLQSLAAQP